MEIKNSFWVLIAFLWLMTSCDQKKTFVVAGVVENATGETLYLERTELNKTSVLDSVKLTSKGNYKFKQARPQYPDFYRLRMGKNTIPFAIDSCEQITINSQKDNFSINYKVENSPNSEKIYQLRLSSQKVQKLYSDSSSTGRTEEERLALIDQIELHKALAREIILDETYSTAAYFAITQSAYNFYYFSLYNEEDLRYWAIVGTGFKTKYPDYNRSKQLEKDVLTTLYEQQRGTLDVEALMSGEADGTIDITLKNRAGELTSLSSLRGKVVLLDFSVYGMEEAASYTLFLRELYNAYHADGFEIYQVSLDTDRLLWMTQSRQTPWVCVRDEAALRSRYLITFNVTQLPTLFLVNREGDIVGRHTADDIAEAIERILEFYKS